MNDYLTKTLKFVNQEMQKIKEEVDRDEEVVCREEKCEHCRDTIEEGACFYCKMD